MKITFDHNVQITHDILIYSLKLASDVQIFVNRFQREDELLFNIILNECPEKICDKITFDFLNE